MEMEQYMIKEKKFYIQANLLITKQKAMENYFMIMVIIILGNLKTIQKMGQEYYMIIIIKLDMLVNILKVNMKVMGNYFIVEVFIIQVN